METLEISAEQLKKRLDLLDAQKKTEYEEGERKKRENEICIMKIKQNIVDLKRQLEKNHLNKMNLLYMPLDVATVQPVHALAWSDKMTDVKKLHINKLKNLLNQLIDHRKKKTIKLDRLKITVETSTSADPSTPPDPKKDLRKLNNALDCVIKRQLETKVLASKYLQIEVTLKQEREEFDQRVRQMQDRIASSDGYWRRLTDSRDYAQNMHIAAAEELNNVKHQMKVNSKERMKNLAHSKQLTAVQETEHAKIAKKLFGDSTIPTGENPGSSAQQRNLNMDDEFFGLTDTPIIMGASSMDEVAKRFEMQLETRERLNLLKTETEQQFTALAESGENNKQNTDNTKFCSNNTVQESKQTAETERKISELEEEVRRIDSVTERIGSVLTKCRQPFLEILQMLQTEKNSHFAENNPDISEMCTKISHSLRQKVEQLSSKGFDTDTEALPHPDTTIDGSFNDYDVGNFIGARETTKKQTVAFSEQSSGPVSVLTRQQMKRLAKDVVEARSRKSRTPSILDKMKKIHYH